MANKKVLVTYGVSGSTFNAGGKAPADVISILSAQGYEVIRLDYLSLARWYRPLLIPYYAVKLAAYLRKAEVAVLQHPYDSLHDALQKINSIAFRLAERKRRIRKTALIHDIATLRLPKEDLHNLKKEMNVLSQYDCLIVHSQVMGSYLLENGYKGDLTVLGLFDYMVSCPFAGERTYSHDVVFAGNLSKSLFLKELDKVFNRTALFLYGKEPGFIPESGNVIYKGSFDSDNLSSIEGSWGLIWDGDTCDKCSGELGDYLKYNSPHKASMYICAHLPIIAPESSAVAAIIRENNIGITISSLLELEEKLCCITPDDYAVMQANIIQLSIRLMQGENLLTAILRISKTLHYSD